MRTRLSPWQYKLAKEADNAMKYVEINHTTISHNANQEVLYAIPFPDGIEGVLIHTLRVTSQANLNFIVKLMDGNSDLVIYESLEETKMQYDVVNIPYKPADRTLYVKILNKGAVATRFDIQVKGIEVI